MAANVSPTIQFSPEPTVLVGVALLGLLYVIAWRRARATGARHGPGIGRLVLFGGGEAAVLAALVSPVDGLGDQLLVMHMVQHVLLLDIAPILMILSLNKVLLRPVTRRVRVIERRAGALARPAAAVILYVGLMWLWHVPAMYDVALRHSGVHALEHVCFSVAGTLYWWHLLAPIRNRHRLTGLGPVAYMVATKLGVGLLGVLLAFAPDAIYPFYAHHPRYWGLSPHTDQSMAGLVMALEQSVVMGTALVWVFMRMLGDSEREQQRRERFGIAS